MAVAEEARRRKARDDQNEPGDVRLLAIPSSSMYAQVAKRDRRVSVCLPTPVVTMSFVLPLCVRLLVSA